MATNSQGCSNRLSTRSSIGSQASGRLEPPSNSLVAVIDRNRYARIHIDELGSRAAMRVSRPVERGERIGREDVLEVDTLDLGSVAVPEDAGLICLFSIGWRRGLLFDLGPLLPSCPTRRTFDVSRLLGRYATYLLFQTRFQLGDLEHERLMAADWFPFAGISESLLRAMIDHVREGRSPDDLAEDVLAWVTSRVGGWLTGWEKIPTFAPHRDLLSHAVGRFQEGDHLSPAAVLYPRIEGLLRSRLTSGPLASGSDQRSLCAAAISGAEDPFSLESSAFLPRRFREYLYRSYFARFRPGDPAPPISRNSVAHGVADQKSFNAKASTLALLIVHQIFCFALADETSRQPFNAQ